MNGSSRLTVPRRATRPTSRAVTTPPVERRPGAPRLPVSPSARSTALAREQYDRTLEATFLANTSGYEIGAEEKPNVAPDFAFDFGVRR